MRKLYIFSNGGSRYFEICYAMADDGVVLASHACSHIGFAEGDLITNRPERKEMYEKHFGGAKDEAFEVIILEAGKLPPKEVIDLNDIARIKAKIKNDLHKTMQTAQAEER